MPPSKFAPRAEHGDETPGEQCLHDLGVVIVGETDRRGSGSEHRLLPQDPAVQLLQLRAWVDTELLGERGATGVIDIQRFRLPSRAVEREHQLRP